MIIAVAVGLSLNNYLRRSAPGFWESWIGPVTDGEFAHLSWWTVSNVICLGVLPVGVARWAGWSLGDMGFGVGSLRRHARWYFTAAAVMVPVVIGVSRLPAFQTTYPFYAATEAPHYLQLLPVWWALYALQFVAVEGLFRGLLAVGVARRLRISPLVAAGLATIPYAMIHFGKPAPETFGAIVAGMTLSWLAMRSRSIWGGVALHITVALTMDIAVLHHLGIW
jgi:membrane protease YdiL (CAAX protease family)